jgi:hypothetical protein
VASSILGFVTAEQIARWCGVSVRTARLWKTGARRPSRQSLRLISLYRDERVLDGVWAGFTVRGEHLVDPHGNTVSRGNLLAYVLIIQYAADMARRAGPEAQDRFYQLLGA